MTLKIKDIFKEENINKIMINFIFFLAGVGSSLILLFISSCSHIKNLKNDSLPEEIIEEVIESATGLDVDLTPSSPEK